MRYPFTRNWAGVGGQCSDVSKAAEASGLGEGARVRGWFGDGGGGDEEMWERVLLEHPHSWAGLGYSYNGQAQAGQGTGFEDPGSGHYQGLRMACVEMGKYSPR